MTEERLWELCREWQERLRLQDWQVKVVFSRPWEFQVRGRQGECHSQLDQKVAVIRLLNPADFPPDELLPRDVEVTLVHELLHLHAAPIQFEEGTLEDLALEQLIEFAAQALVALERARSEFARLATAAEPDGRRPQNGRRYQHGRPDEVRSPAVRR